MKKITALFLGVACSISAFATTGPIYSNDLNGTVSNRNAGAASATRFSGSDKLVVTSSQINDTEGTIVFWVKPNYRFHDAATHTFVHSLLNTPAAIDFVFADGYWPAPNDKWYNDGSDWLYFVHKNSAGTQSPHVVSKGVNALIEKDRDPLQNTWKMVTLTWKTGTGGNLSVYINGRIPLHENLLQSIEAFNFAGFQRDGTGNATIYIGNNAAGTNPSEADIDDLKIYDRSLSAAEVNDLFINSFPTSAAADDFRDRKWLYPELLPNSYNPKRDKYNKIIENRVIFDESAMYLSQGVPAVISKIVAANMNIYVPNIWHGRGVRWKRPATSSTVEPIYDSEVNCLYSSTQCHANAADANQASDKLADLIQAAHAQGIQVHPWFTIAKYDWAVLGIDNHLNWTYAVGTERAYDLENTDFKQYIRNQIMDVVSRYDIDGINLDYIRFIGEISGSHAQIEAESARRRPIVTNFLTYLVGEIRAVKPNLPISIDGSPVSELDHRFNHKDDEQGRNQLVWLENNLINAGFDMDYEKIINTSEFDFASKHYLPAINKSPNAVIKLLGNYEPTDPVTSRNSSTLTDLVKFSQVRWPGSVAIYWLDEFFRTPGQVTALTSGSSAPFYEPSRPLWKFNGPELKVSLSKAANQILTTDNVVLDADAIDLEDGNRSSSVIWSLNGVEFFTGDSTARSFPAGNHVLTATASNSRGQTDSVCKNLVVAVSGGGGGIGEACQHGLTAQYFNNETLTGPAALTRIDSNVDFNWGLNSPGGSVDTDNFSVRWTGRLIVPAYTGTYNFCIKGDDGYRLWINNTSILDFWMPLDSVKKCANISLTAGQMVPIQLEFFDALEHAIVQMTWTPPGQSESVVPSSQLYAQ